MRLVCEEAIQGINFAAGDVICSPGLVTKAMLFVMSGEVSHSMPQEHRAETSNLGPQTWILEVALWTKWLAKGTSTAVMASELAEVQRGSFSALVKTDPKTYSFIQRYAALFV